MTLEESREIIPLMESMIGQIEEQQTLMAEMLLEMQNRDTQLSLMQEQNQKSVSYTHLRSCFRKI